MLRKWHEPLATSYWVEDVGGKEELHLWNEEEEKSYEIADQLTDEQRVELRHLLEQYKDTLQDKPGRTLAAEHVIDTGTAKPVKLPPYRLPYAYRDQVQKELKEMVKDGIATTSNSEWAAPIVLVTKKDGGIRFCVDYRRLNAVSAADCYPMPRVDELIDRLGSHVSRVKKEDIIRDTLRPVRIQCDAVWTTWRTIYLSTDDGPSVARVGDMVGGIYRRCGRPGCHLERTYYGPSSGTKEASGGGADSQTQQVPLRHGRMHLLGPHRGKWARSTGERQSSSSGGVPGAQDEEGRERISRLTGYYRKIIPEYATIAAPLTELTKKEQPNCLAWSSGCAEAFEALKRHLCTSPVLKCPNFERPFVLQTDASDWGVGAVLSQKDDDDNEHPVAYFSKKLLPRERRYSTIEKECLAIKLATHAFRVYLLGKPFTVQTDHHALEWLV
ncbi:hypothetical protein EMCRGX_G001145 [Ephydatia muelleri]